ncbi:hypothetical protein D1114_17805 [Cereibacter sphaeroides]|uniref:Acid-resistance membrane protein n=1 Tax=Cereibacter sphaeroides TaxID=1063 RepID=A0AAX1UHG4_CERSP|nr:DUF308 domain-containing protein [Cereibacter sphaeroides]RHZ92266.1 hypothetical protein D1114_17805 [Cereibacter sphaeroides]
MKGTSSLIVSGILALLGGIAALAFPLPVSLAVTVLAGCVFVASGAFGLWAAFSDRGMPSRGATAFFSLVSLVAGVWMLANPLAGMVSLTLMLGALFLVSGVVRLGLSLATWRGTVMFWLMALSGLISAGLGLFILLRLPEASLVLLGTLVAVELIVMGATLVAMGFALRKSGNP